MNLAVIGSGGREHAICYKLKQSSRVKNLICIPGNAGTALIAKNIKNDITNFDLIYNTLKVHNINIVIIGIINSKATRIEKEVSFIHSRTQRSKRIEEAKVQKIDAAEDKRRKHYAKSKKRS